MNRESATAHRLRPVARPERIARIDVLRGFALFGVLAANLILASRVMVSPEPAVSLGMAALDPLADGLYVFFIRGKFYHLFAFLFGLGFSLQLARAEERGADHARIFVRRMSWLFIFGTAHALLLWWGDILHVYALGGLALLAFRRAGDRAILAVGLVLTFGVWLGHGIFYLLLPSARPETGPESLEARLAVLQEGTYGEVLGENLRVLSQVSSPVSLASLVATSLGLFLLGWWIGRRRRLQTATVDRAFFSKLLAGGLLVGVPLNAVVVGIRILGWGERASPAYLLSVTIGVPALAAAYLALLALAFDRPAWRRRLTWLAPVGRMALSLYLMHSVLFFVILYGAGPGLGLVGSVGPASALVIAAVIFAGQTVLSRWWLARFRFGPIEWLWRSLSYGERPPFRRPTARVSDPVSADPVSAA